MSTTKLDEILTLLRNMERRDREQQSKLNDIDKRLKRLEEN